jgi:ABC-2 type transport system permease protein
MSKFWQIVKYEYKRHVLRRRFLFGLLSVPMIMVLMGAVIFILIVTQTNTRPVGYVDHSGLLAHPLPLPESFSSTGGVKIIPFETEAAAAQALQNDTIQGYYVLGADFEQTKQALLVAKKRPGPIVQAQFQDFLRVNWLAGQPPSVVTRLIEGDSLVVRSLDGSRRMGEKDWFNIFTPFFTGLAFMITMFTTSGYLMQAVVEEKENRTMEVLMTSVSSTQLMSGKIIGIIGVGLTQLLAWIGFATLAVLAGRYYFPFLEAIHISFSSVGLLVITLLPAFVMVAALMVAVGATVTDAREGQQIASLFTFPVVIPYWFTYQLMSNPNGPLAVGLSLFPLTAPVALTMRVGFTYIPMWQVGVTTGILVVSALASLWLAGRAFRLGMLQYGQRLSWRQLSGRGK